MSTVSYEYCILWVLYPMSTVSYEYCIPCVPNIPKWVCMIVSKSQLYPEPCVLSLVSWVLCPESCVLSTVSHVYQISLNEFVWLYPRVNCILCLVAWVLCPESCNLKSFNPGVHILYPNRTPEEHYTVF